MNLSRSTAKIFASRISKSVITFLAIAYFARAIGSAQLGVFFLFQTSISLLSLPTDLGIKIGVEKRISEGKPGDEVLATALLLKTLFIIVVSIPVLIFTSQINGYIGGEVAHLLILALLLEELARLLIAVLRGEMRVGETASLELLRVSGWTLAGALLVYFGFDSLGIIYGYIAGAFLTSIVTFYKIRTGIAMPSFFRVRSLFNYSKYAFIGSIGGMVYSWMDIALIGFFLTQSAVGVYEVAWRVAAVSLLFTQAIRTVLFPKMNELGADGDVEQMENLFEKSITPALIFVIPALFGSIIYSEEILFYLFSPEFATASLVLVIFLFDKVQRAFSLMLIGPIHAFDRPDLAAISTLVGIFLNLLLNIALIPRYGIEGAAFATTVAATVNTGLMYYYLLQYMSPKIPFVEIAWCIVSSLILLICLLIIDNIFAVGSLADLVLIVASAVIVYSFFVLLNSEIRRKTFQTVRNF